MTPRDIHQATAYTFSMAPLFFLLFGQNNVGTTIFGHTTHPSSKTGILIWSDEKVCTFLSSVADLLDQYAK
jgi:hypothetical protein